MNEDHNVDEYPVLQALVRALELTDERIGKVPVDSGDEYIAERQELMRQRTFLVAKIADATGAAIIADISNGKN
jgi:RecA/RadA recombinase